MRRSTEKILTTHVGALPGDEAVWTGKASEHRVRAAVAEVVAMQRDASPAWWAARTSSPPPTEAWA